VIETNESNGKWKTSQQHGTSFDCLAPLLWWEALRARSNEGNKKGNGLERRENIKRWQIHAASQLKTKVHKGSTP